MIITELQDWLKACCDDLEDVVEGTVALAGVAGTHPVACWSRSGLAVSDQVLHAAQSAARSEQLVVATISTPPDARSLLGQVVCLPLAQESTVIGVVAVGLASKDPVAAQKAAQALRQASDPVLSMCALLADAKVSIDANTVLQLQAAVLSRQRFDEAASVFATRLAELFGCDRASAGFVEDGYAVVAATSHGAAVDAQQAIHRVIAAAMDEAIDQAGTISFPAATGGRPRITLAHAELTRRHGSSACSIPMAILGAVVGAVTLERARDRGFTEREIALCEHLVSLIAPVLALKRDNERSWRSRARHGLAATWSRLTGPGELRLKLGSAAVALAFVILFLVPVPYSITAPARLEGSIQRALVAASDGFLQQVSVRPGDVVKDGQVLAELAQHDLQLERSKWESELAQQINAYGAALARADRALLMVNHAKAAEARAQLELVENQIARAQIRAPFEGVIISGDLTNSLGSPVRRGEVLMVMAPRERYRLIVEVDERDIANLRTGARGRVTLAAAPGQALPFQSERVAPLAVTREGRHFFEVEGKLDTTSPALRPGLQGVARIEAENRSLAAMGFGRMLDWLHLTLWSWGWLG